MEVQIRSWEMHLMAEDGIASHWRYKSDDGTLPDEDIKRFKWFKQILDELTEVEDPRELMETVRTDLFPDEVYVFTPKGDVKEFPAGATVLVDVDGLYKGVKTHAWSSANQATAPKEKASNYQPGHKSLDMTLAKFFNLTERFRLELKMEVYNLTNTFTGADPNTSVTSSSFGRVTSMARESPGREFQYNIRLHF